MAGGPDNYAAAVAAAAAARARLAAAERDRDHIDAVVDAGGASFADLARASAIVRRAHARADAAEEALRAARAARGGVADAPLSAAAEGCGDGSDGSGEDT